MYKVEKGIPIKKSVKKHMYPFDKMEIGDSFCIIPSRSKFRSDKEFSNECCRLQRVVCSASYMHAKRFKEGFKITTRCDEKGVRVWRKS